MTDTADARPFKVLGIQQIAVGGTDLGAMRHFWGDLLGVKTINSVTVEAENVVEDILEVGSGSATVEIDLMQPLDLDARPKVHEPALNHVGLWIDDLPAAVEWLEASGVRFTPGGIRPGASGHDICFIHPKGNEASPYGGQGVLIELVQAPEDLDL